MSDPKIIKELLYKNKKTFDVALKAENNEVVVNNYILNIVNTLTLNPSLLNCTPESIQDAAITSATLGIPIDAQKLAYLIPYQGKAQFQLSYKGYVHIAKRDPEVDNIVSVIVYKDDKFEIDLGANTLLHIPNLESESYGKDDAIKYVYALVRFRKNTGRENQFEVMTKAQIDAIRATSKNGGKVDKWGNPTTWEGNYGEMGRKTVIKRLCKHAQLGDTSRFDEVDNAIEENRIINVTPEGAKCEDFLEADKVRILEEVEGCQNEEELREIGAKNSEKLEEIACYNMAFSKILTKAFKDKQDNLFCEKIKFLLSDCEDDISLDKVYTAHEKRIEFLRAALRDDIIAHYVSLKNDFMDRAV